MEALEKITTTNILNLFKISILGRYGIPQCVVIDNKTQFTYKHLKKLFEYLKVKHHFMLVEHLMTNVQAKATNWDLMKGLKRIHK